MRGTAEKSGLAVQASFAVPSCPSSWRTGINHDSGNEAASVSNLVLIDQAVKESSYDRNHIAYLARKGSIRGEKHGGVWLIDLDSLKEYEAQMQTEGTKKFDPTRYKSQKAS